MPEIRLTPDQAARFIVVDYEKYLPVAPGIVLIKAAGHTPGSQMVYIALESGRELLLIGDTTWHMDGVRQMRGQSTCQVEGAQVCLVTGGPGPAPTSGLILGRA